MKKILIIESTDEDKVLLFLKDVIKNTEWDNKILLVGGAVRDEIMGKKPKDLDFVVNGGISAGIDFSTWLANKLGNYKHNSNPVIYPRFGTAKLSLTNNKFNLPSIDLEFVAPRKESYTHGSRNPDVSNGDLMDETLRRDLTINSLMKNITTNEIIDLSGHGVDDIKKGIIRTTSSPEIIFKDDPLRMLRAIRFSVKYNFKILPEVIDNIKQNSMLIDYITKERINDELNKILLTNDPARGIKLLQETKLLKYIIPEFNIAIGMKQNKYHNEDVFNHTLTVLSNTPPNLRTRLIALFHDIGKTVTKTTSPDGEVHFYGHENESEKIVRKIMQRLKYPNDLIDDVAKGVQYHMYLKHGEDDASKLSDKTLRKFALAVGENIDDILDAIHADNISHTDDKSMKNQINIIRDRLKNLNTSPDKPKLPINGNDLIKLGLKPSKLFSDIFSAVQDAWLENPEINKDDALKIVNDILISRNITEIKTLMKKIL